MKLYHFTCDHSIKGIRRDGVLRPWPQPILGESLVWFTDMPDATRDQLGLTSPSITCDRMAHRFDVDLAELDALYWPFYARDIPRNRREALEGTPGALPAHWWVSTQPVAVS